MVFASTLAKYMEVKLYFKTSDESNKLELSSVHWYNCPTAIPNFNIATVISI